MRIIGEVDDDYMLAAYRKASGRTPKRYKKRQGIWEGLPACRWWTAELTIEDFKQVSLIRNELNWLALGGYKREPTVAAHWVSTHLGIEDDTREYAAQMDLSNFPDFPVILVGPPHPSPKELVVLDGNHRVTAICLTSGLYASRMPVLIGTHPRIDKWAYYRDGKRIKKTLNEVGW